MWRASSDQQRALLPVRLQPIARVLRCFLNGAMKMSLKQPHSRLPARDHRLHRAVRGRLDIGAAEYWYWQSQLLQPVHRLDYDGVDNCCPRDRRHGPDPVRAPWEIHCRVSLGHAIVDHNIRQFKQSTA
jgi:hypothetical protein